MAVQSAMQALQLALQQRDAEHASFAADLKFGGIPEVQRLPILSTCCFYLGSDLVPGMHNWLARSWAALPNCPMHTAVRLSVSPVLVQRSPRSRPVCTLCTVSYLAKRCLQSAATDARRQTPVPVTTFLSCLFPTLGTRGVAS